MFRTLRAWLRRSPLLRDIKRNLQYWAAVSDTADYAAAEVSQKALLAAWLLARSQGVVLPLASVGFKRHSEFEEDGVILYLMTLAGCAQRTVVEISAQDGRTCMAANLIIHHRWRGFLFDGDAAFVRAGRRFFGRHPATRADPPVFEACWFTRDNINSVLASHGVPPEIDVLSLDVDGVDLHLWAALTCTSPRLLVCEFNNAIPAALSLTVPYSDDFDFGREPHALHRSASLAAYVEVGRAKGYRLVGFNALGFNAYFLRDDVLAAEFAEMPASALTENGFAARMRDAHWPQLRELPWQAPPSSRSGAVG